jgi:hypothetical protein
MLLLTLKSKISNKMKEGAAKMDQKADEMKEKNNKKKTVR